MVQISLSGDLAFQLLGGTHHQPQKKDVEMKDIVCLLICAWKNMWLQFPHCASAC